MTIEKELVNKYNEVYKDGEEKFWTFLPIEERTCILNNVDFTGKTVLELGAGSCDFAAWMATAGAKTVVAIDASADAISKGRDKYKLPNLIMCCGYIGGKHWTKSRAGYDVVVMVGVLEHTNDPKETLKIIHDEYMKPGGLLVTSSPHFCNPRGYIWLALKYLCDAKMSLTDKHEIDPKAMVEVCVDIGLKPLNLISVDKSWGCGKRFIQDYVERLPKVFPKMGTHKIDLFLSKVMGAWEKDLAGDGANVVYFFHKPE